MTSQERIARAEKNSLNNWKNQFVNLDNAGTEQGIGWDAEGCQYSFLRGCSKPDLERQRKAYEQAKADRPPMFDLDKLSRLLANGILVDKDQTVRANPVIFDTAKGQP